MGDFCLVQDALARDCTTPHCTGASVIAADPDLVQRIEAGWTGSAIKPVRAATNDANYRESDALLGRFRAAGCQVVNLDSAHPCPESLTNSAAKRVRTVQFGVVSDVIERDGQAESALAAMLVAGSEGVNPLERTGEIVRFYVETMAPRLRG